MHTRVCTAAKMHIETYTPYHPHTGKSAYVYDGSWKQEAPLQRACFSATCRRCEGSSQEEMPKKVHVSMSA
jgi:hypothetical protein